MQNEHDIMTYYQSTLRTIGQYMLVSLGLLGYSRFYRKQKNDVYNVAFIALSLLILIIATCICFFLIKDLTRYKSALDNKTTYVDKWLTIPKIILVANISIATFGIFTLIRESRKL
jgi:heme/copper-type cytochrome/quinol oxidase subunit 2|tara:strand:- start:889 stop:1236 length:348 start_codon:yes stop_codon:yes gene_type:complete